MYMKLIYLIKSYTCKTRYLPEFNSIIYKNVQKICNCIKHKNMLYLLSLTAKN